MLTRPGFWAYASATGAAVATSVALASAFGISGRADVALTIACLGGAVYAITPAENRGEAKRLWGMVALALGGLMLGSGVAVMAGMAIAPGMILDAESEAARAAAPSLILAMSSSIAVLGYLGVFRLGWPLVRPAQTAPAAGAPRFL